MQEKVFKIIDEAGIHARPATLLVKAASDFQSDVNLEFNGKTVNLKSIMGVMALGISNGAEIKIIASGEDESKALESVSEVLLANGLGQ